MKLREIQVVITQFKENGKDFLDEVPVDSEKEVVFVPAKCGCCGQMKASKRISPNCDHLICKYCIKSNMVDKLEAELFAKRKVQSGIVSCPQEGCKNIISKRLLGALIKVLARANAQASMVEKLDNIYEMSPCCGYPKG
mmetsp:Transcript_21451/g.20626  ORF Transcript_21451/g.20626 Transcript_21451/m.20626 type:complete len:139 (-) Transcript_21451:449-865(-)